MRLLVLPLMLIVMSTVACSPPRKHTTRLDATDLVAMTDRMAESLLTSPAVASRNGMSPGWIISVDRVTNRTSEVIPHRQLWAFMGRLRALLNESPAMTDRKMVFVLSPDQAAVIGERHAELNVQRAKPTHALAATFSSLTLDSRSSRSDTYVCAYQLIDLSNDHVLWEDRYEVKRTVMRDEWD